ncbi:NAD(P)/FAD-dependent oxidoreductase [Halorarius halobius]|uniref:NAD(P)/FAD-dependent oxidoreductase n=1 Tax=Halorarius halobius TaxID=2962671 RepID=UPI0020CE6514|nr:FAD-dependent oxidoreductase [Halorarius halobius]
MHVAVLGAGYAGVAATRRLERSLPDGADITLVDETDYHLVQHELHRVIRRPELAEVIRVPLDEVVDRAEIVTARVESVDAADGVVAFDGREPLNYDYGVVALGAVTDFHGLADVETHATPLKRLEHAERIRAEFFADEGGRVVVGGAGLSGVQVAGELAATADEEGFDADVVLLEQFDSVAPGFPAPFSTAVREALDARDVTIRTGVTVDGADADAVTLASGDALAYDQFVWTGGIRGSPAMGGQRPETRSDLRGENGTFLVGDAARVVDAGGEAVPASAQTAIREARVAADNVAALVAHDLDDPEGFPPRLDRYTFDSPGWVVSVGDGAVAQVGPTVLRGQAARAAKATIGAGYLGGMGAVREAAALVREEL